MFHSARSALLRAGDEAELLDLICRIAVHEAGYRLAWVGLAEDDPERTVRPVAHAGNGAEYLGSIKVTWADTLLGKGPTGTAIRTGRPVVGRNFFADPELAPWREAALRHGFASSAALPLRAGDGAFGALSVYAAEPNAITADEVALLAGLADDLALGITTLRARASRDASEEGLLRSERNLAEAQRIAHIGSWDWDLATGTAERSEELFRIFGVEPAAIHGTSEAFLAYVHPDDRARVQASQRAAAGGSGPHDLDYRIIRPDGAVRILHELGGLIRDPAGTPVRMVGTVQDISEQVAADEERARLASAVEQTADAVWMQDADGIVTFVNRSFSRMYGYEPDEIVGRFAGIVDSGHRERASFDAIWASVASGKTWTGSIVNRRKDGSHLEVEAVISGIRDAAGRLVSYMQTDRDVSRERTLERALAREAREREAIEAALKRLDPEGTPEAIAGAACAEILRLAGVDSAFAISVGAGRGRIVAAAGRVENVLTVGASIPEARARHLLDRAVVGPWAETLHNGPQDGTYGETIGTTGFRATVYAPLSGSHGVVGVIGFSAHDPANAEGIIERLPAFAIFGSIIGALVAPGLEARHREDDARAIIRAILDTGAFTPFFQPIVELHTGTVLGYEALSRFADGTQPDIVFRMAERVGLGMDLEVATLRAALEAATVLPPATYLSLNASPDLILSGALRELFAGSTREIALEITEHVVVDDYGALRRALMALGPAVRLAVDDAGAGYASLRHILELAPDLVKLDIGLIRGIDTDPARQALIAGMSYFGVKGKLRLIAEGIETPAELATLRSLGIPYGQGYLLGRPRDGRQPGSWPSEVAMGTG